MGRDRERDKVEEGGYPAVEGRLLVARLDVGLPLLDTPGLTRAEYLSANNHHTLTLTTNTNTLILILILIPHPQSHDLLLLQGNVLNQCRTTEIEEDPRES